MPKKNTTATVDAAFEQIEATINADPALAALAADPNLTLTEEEIAALSSGELVGEPVVEPVAPSEVQPEAGSEPVQEPDGTSDEEPAEDDEVATYDDVIDSISEEELTETIADVKGAFEQRDAYEAAKGGHYDSISKSLDKSGKKLATHAAAEVLIACQVDPNFINRGMTGTAGYNVYAIDKVADIVTCLSSGVLKNAINRAIILSLFAFKAAGVDFTGEHAKAAASANIRVSDAKVRTLLVRHTVAPSTAPTQASSTMSALQTLGIVENAGTQKAPIYRLTDAPQTRRLEEVYVAKAA